MEDITKDFKLPCVMDVKIGVQTWEPDAPQEKIIVERVSIYYPPFECRGIPGAGICDPSSLLGHFMVMIVRSNPYEFLTCYS